MTENERYKRCGGGVLWEPKNASPFCNLKGRGGSLSLPPFASAGSQAFFQEGGLEKGLRQEIGLIPR